MDAPTCRGGAIAIGAAPFRGALFAVEATACRDVVFAVEAATCRGAGLDIVLVAFACREMFGLGGTTTPDFIYVHGQATLLGCLEQLSSRRANELMVVYVLRCESPIQAPRLVALKKSDTQPDGDACLTVRNIHSNGFCQHIIMACKPSLIPRVMGSHSLRR